MALNPDGFPVSADTNSAVDWSARSQTVPGAMEPVSLAVHQTISMSKVVVINEGFSFQFDTEKYSEIPLQHQDVISMGS